jgi:hypothetical protein
VAPIAGPEGTEAMSGPDRAADTVSQAAGQASADATATAGEVTSAVSQAADKAASTISEVTDQATAAASQASDEATERAGDVARTFIEDALQPPKAVEDTASFRPRPGSPAAEPAVQEARAEAEAARAALAMELDRLRDRGREAVDVKAKVKAMPSAIARDPRKLVGLGAAGAGAGLLLRTLRGGRRKAMPPGLLPADVEAALGGVGPDAEKVREALESGFTSYLETYGAKRARRRERLPGLVSLFILPVASTAAREAIKRFATGGPRKGGAA